MRAMRLPVIALVALALASCSGSHHHQLAAPAYVATDAGVESVTVSWAAVPGATAYNVERLDHSTWLLIATGQPGPSYTDTGLCVGVQQTYRVVAYNAREEGIPSVSVSATPVNIFGRNVISAAN